MSLTLDVPLLWGLLRQRDYIDVDISLLQQCPWYWKDPCCCKVTDSTPMWIYLCYYYVPDIWKIPAVAISLILHWCGYAPANNMFLIMELPLIWVPLRLWYSIDVDKFFATNMSLILDIPCCRYEDYYVPDVDMPLLLICPCSDIG